MHNDTTIQAQAQAGHTRGRARTITEADTRKASRIQAAVDIFDSLGDTRTFDAIGEALIAKDGTIV